MPTSYSNIGENRGGDPNILKLEASNRVRPLDNLVADWKQHTIQNPKDDQQITMVVCPGPRSCPLCRKPVDPTRPDNDNSRFPMSRRFGANVWDFESQTVKVLVAGPQVFDEFKTAAKMGIEPATCDWTIVKEGQGRNTKYQVVRHDAAPGPNVTPDQLLDVGKYEAPTSVERIFEILEQYGIDYDSLPVPEYDLDAALAFVMPYTAAKGLTIEKLLDTDESKALWLHGQKLEQGQLGDPVFVALQKALEARGVVPPLDDALAAMPEPEPQQAAEPGPAAEDKAPDSIPEPGPGETRLIARNGIPVNVPDSSVESLLNEAAGFTRPEPPAAAPAADLPDEHTPTKVVIAGQVVELPRGEAVKLVAAEQATYPEDEAPAAPAQEPLRLPLPDEMVDVKIGDATVPMMYVSAEKLVESGSAQFVDEKIAAAYQRFKDEQDKHSIAEQAAAEQANPASVPEPAAEKPAADPDKPHQCQLCDKAYKTKGALTQHMNKEHGGAPAAPAPAATPAPAAAQAAPAAAKSPANDGVDETLRERVKDKIAKSPFAKDYNAILKIFESTTGKKNIMEMDDAELTKLETAIDEAVTKGGV